MGHLGTPFLICKVRQKNPGYKIGCRCMKACLLLFFYFSLIGQLHGADVKIKENESVMGSTAMTYDLS